MYTSHADIYIKDLAEVMMLSYSSKDGHICLIIDMFDTARNGKFIGTLGIFLEKN